MSGEPRYPEVWVDVPPDEADEASALLFELGALGVEQRDASTLAAGEVPGKITLVASFGERGLATDAVGQLDRRWSPRFSELVGDAWRDEWKKHFAPFRLTDRITVRPPWQAYEPAQPGAIVLELEPGRAFGTGLHPSTALVARALETSAGEFQGGTVLDVGTGSGILALVALALGAAHVRAIDIDPDAVLVAQENARRNGLDERIDADASPLESLPAGYDVVVANIEAAVLSNMAHSLARRVRAAGIVILSGILTEQKDEVLQAFAGSELVEAPVEGEWTALVLRAKS